MYVKEKLLVKKYNRLNYEFNIDVYRKKYMSGGMNVPFRIWIF